MFLLTPLVLPWVVYLVFGQIFNLLYYAIAVVIIAIMFKAYLSVKSILIFGIAVVLSFELFSFIDFQLNYMNDGVHFEGNDLFPKEMYRDYDSYFDFQYIDNSPKNHIKRHVYLLDSAYSICFVVFYANIFLKRRSRLSRKKGEVLDQNT